MNSPHQARMSSHLPMFGLALVVALIGAFSWSAEAKPVFKKIERGDCECWCKTSAGTYTHVEFGVTAKACWRIQSKKTCTDGQGNEGKLHGCAFYGGGSDALSAEPGQTADPTGGEVLQFEPRVIPQDLPAILAE